MSIGFASIAEAAISGQERVDKVTTTPGGVVYYPAQKDFKPVEQSWIDEAIVPVYHVSRVV